MRKVRLYKKGGSCKQEGGDIKQSSKPDQTLYQEKTNFFVNWLKNKSAEVEQKSLMKAQNGKQIIQTNIPINNNKAFAQDHYNKRIDWRNPMNKISSGLEEVYSGADEYKLKLPKGQSQYDLFGGDPNVTLDNIHIDSVDKGFRKRYLNYTATGTRNPQDEMNDSSFNEYVDQEEAMEEQQGQPMFQQNPNNTTSFDNTSHGAMNMPNMMIDKAKQQDQRNNQGNTQIINPITGEIMNVPQEDWFRKNDQMMNLLMRQTGGQATVQDSLDSYNWTQDRLKELEKNQLTQFGSKVDLSSKKYITKEEGIKKTYDEYKELAKRTNIPWTMKDAEEEWTKYDENVKNVGAYLYTKEDGSTYTLFDYKKPQGAGGNEKKEPNLNTDLSAWLKTQGAPASYADRKKMYEEATGKTDYKGTADQNIGLLNTLKEKGLDYKYSEPETQSTEQTTEQTTPNTQETNQTNQTNQTNSTGNRKIVSWTQEWVDQPNNPAGGYWKKVPVYRDYFTVEPEYKKGGGINRLPKYQMRGDVNFPTDNIFGNNPNINLNQSFQNIGTAGGYMDFISDLNTMYPQSAQEEMIEGDMTDPNSLTEPGRFELDKVNKFKTAFDNNPYLMPTMAIGAMDLIGNIGELDEQRNRENQLRERVSNVHRSYNVNETSRGDYMVNTPKTGDGLKPDEHLRKGFNTKIAQRGMEVNEELEMSDEEIQELIAQGYKIEFL
jgi:hypothetical protein